MKKIKSIIVSVVLILIFILNNTMPIKAQENPIHEIISTIIKSDSCYSIWNDCIICLDKELKSNTSNKYYYLYKLYYENDYKGYLIADSSNVLWEFSMSETPYDLAIKKYFLNNIKCYYDYGNYSIFYNNNMIFIDEGGSKIVLNKTDFNYNIIDGYISGKIKPQLQYDNNCIVTAMSNLIWYYGNNDYPDLIKSKSFAKLEKELDKEICREGGYSNKNIPNVLAKYLKSYYSWASNDWNPYWSKVKSEIDGNHPFLLGFAAGSDYSKSVGHMTLCVGYLKISSDNYVCLADGHSEKIITKKWSKYNDFMCKVRLNK